MNSCLFTFQSPPPANCFEQLVWVLNGLAHVIGYRRRHDWTVWRIAEALIARVHRVRKRLLALIEAVRAGKPLPMRARKGERREDPKAAQRRIDRREIWFGIKFGYAWLCPLVPMDAAVLGGYLNQVLADAEMRRLMAQDARIAKLLRPFVKMLAGDARLLDATPEEAVAARAATGGAIPSGKAAVAVVAPAAGSASVPVSEFLKGT